MNDLQTIGSMLDETHNGAIPRQHIHAPATLVLNELNQGNRQPA